MFANFDKSAAFDRLGMEILQYSTEFIIGDGLRALGANFPACDASRGWGPVFRSHGVPTSAVKSFIVLYAHCVLQAALLGYSVEGRRKMVEGAVAGLAERPADYDFPATFDELEAVFDGRYRFGASLDWLDSGKARASLRAEQPVGDLVAMYLFETFIVPRLGNNRAFINGFDNLSRTIASTVATIERAASQMASTAKQSP